MKLGGITMSKKDSSTKPSERTTSKKVKIIGTQKLYNASTGEIIDCQVTNIEERDFNFAKVWMRNFIYTIDTLGNQKTKIALWIVENINKENQLISTMQNMADSTKSSLETVRMTIKILQEVDFMRKTQNGVYTINPNIYFKGSHNQRMNILNQYSALGYHPPKITKKEKISQIEDMIAELNKELEGLKKEAITVETDGQLEMLPDGNIAERAKET